MENRWNTVRGDFAVMAPGHDAWVVGNEPCVVIDWHGYADYAKG